MTRLIKVLSVLGLSSVYLMQAPCVNTGSGIAIPLIKQITGFISVQNILGT